MMKIRLREAETLEAGKRFGRYGPESEKAAGKPKVEESKVLIALGKTFQDFQFPKDSTAKGLTIASKLLKKQGYSSRDVELFSLMLHEFQDSENFSQRAGIFLSALINGGREKEYIVQNPGGLTIDYLCSANTKKVIVNGSVNHGIASGMKKGKVIVEGDTGGTAGWYMRGGRLEISGTSVEPGASMSGGTILIGGNARTAGISMDGGKLIVSGNCDTAGTKMLRGEIQIGGDCGSVGIDMEGGRIRVKGRLLPRPQVGFKCGERMKGGEIHLDGGLENDLSEEHLHLQAVRGGKIFLKGKLVLDK